MDHENVAAGLCVLEPDPECLDVAAGGAEDHASKPSSSALFELALFLPNTRLSKSSVLPLVSSSPFARFEGARLDMKSARLADVALDAESS